MKKTRIIAIVLAIAVMLMGAGYAYWSDTLVINNTVTTGEFQVSFTAMEPFPFIVDSDEYLDSDITPNYGELLAAGGVTNTLTVTVSDMYPGSMALYAMKAENLGTIPAVFDYAEVILDGADEEIDSALLRQNLAVLGGFIEFNEDGDMTGDAGSFGIDGFNSNGTVNFATLAELEDRLDTMFAGLSLEPGDYILFDIPEEGKAGIADAVKAYNPDAQNCFIYYLPEGVGNDLQNQDEQFTIKLHFKQQNAPLTVR